MNKETKCYCGHTDYCDCGPLKEPKQEKIYSEKDLEEAFKGGGKMSWSDMNQETQEPYYYDFNEWFEQFNKTILNNKI